MLAIGRFLILFVLTVTLVACGGSSSGKSRDTSDPVITLTGANPQVIEAGTAYVELGATASDNRDGDLTNSVAIDASAIDTQVPGTYAVTYTVTDAAGNSGTASRTVVVEDTTPPVITLLGDDPQIIVAPNPYIELGATASDTLDGDLTAAIAIDATSVDTMVVGDYSVTYDVMDAAGNTAVTETRSIRVELPLPPAAPQVTVEGDIKQLIFSWDEIANADYYRLMENPDGHSGFTQVGDDIPIGTLSATRDIAVHLHDWVNALYIVQACNIGGCAGSAEVSAVDVMLDTIGYLKASNTGPHDAYDYSIALSSDGETLVIGATGEDSSASGVNGDESDNSLQSAGAAYVFRADGTAWRQEAYVKASNPNPYPGCCDSFGYSVALSADGNTLAVGANGEGSAASGVNGDQADNSADNSGAVYLFRYDGTGWDQQAYIKASNPDGQDSFGWSVAMGADGNTLAVGAVGEASIGTGVDSNQADNSAWAAGAVYVFRFDGSDWSQQSYVKASNASGGDRFGHSLVLSADGNTLAAGAPREDSGAVGINGDQADDLAANSGAVYLFRFDGTDWKQEAYIKASNTSSDDWFGSSVSLSAYGDALAVGAPGEDSTATGIEGNQSIDHEVGDSGAAYVFRFDGAHWLQESYIKASNTGSGGIYTCESIHFPPQQCELPGDYFGSAVALSADSHSLAVGAPRESSRVSGIDGDQDDDSADNAGAVYLFQFNSTDWYQHAYIKAPNTDAWDSFGDSLVLSADGSSLAVGAPGEDSSATGINSDQTDNSAESSGAAYVY